MCVLMRRVSCVCVVRLCRMQSLEEYMEIVRDCVALDKNVLIARKYVAQRLFLNLTVCVHVL